MSEPRWSFRTDRIYIVPNRYGFLAFGGIMVILSAGVWFASPLAYLLTACLTTIVLMAMIQCNTNLKNLSLKWFEAEAAPQGGFTLLHFFLVNTGRVSRIAIAIELDDETLKFDPVVDSTGTMTTIREVLPQLSAACEMRLFAQERGVHPAPRIRIASVFPLGLFYAWQWQHVAGECVVYPRPLAGAALPLSSAQASSSALETQTLTPAGERADFWGHRSFQPGDSLAAVDWKARARGRPLLLKEFHGLSQPTRILTWEAAAAAIGNRDPLNPQTTEAILSQLTSWVLQMGPTVSFLLVLPTVRIGPEKGEHHLGACLRHLALVKHAS